MELTDDQIIEAALEVDLWDIYDEFQNKSGYQEKMWKLRMFLKIISELDDHNSFFSAPLLPPSLFDPETEPDPEVLGDAARFRWAVENGKLFSGKNLSFVRDKIDFEMAWEHKAKTNP